MTEDDWCPLVSAGYWSDLRADTGTLFPTRSRRSTQLHKEESLFFVKGMLVAPLLTAGVSGESLKSYRC